MIFKKGDKVVVKSWEEMQNEFPGSDQNKINCKYCFLNDMRYLCGEKFVINKIEIDGNVCLEGMDQFLNINWNISTDMIKHDVDEDFKIDINTELIGYELDCISCRDSIHTGNNVAVNAKEIEFECVVIKDYNCRICGCNLFDVTVFIKVEFH